MLGLSAGFKYAQGSIANLSKLAAACRAPAMARTQLFEWLVFNVLIGNGDAHLKKLSFMVSHDGVQLAPFYDLVGSSVYGSRAFDADEWPAASTLAWPILGAGRFEALNRALLLEAGAELSLAPATAERLLDRLAGRIGMAAEQIYAEAEAANAQWAADTGAALAGEMRCLRTLRATVIAEMANRLAA